MRAVCVLNSINAIRFSPVFGRFCVSPSSPPHSSLSQRPWWKYNYSSLFESLHNASRQTRTLHGIRSEFNAVISTHNSSWENDVNNIWNMFGGNLALDQCQVKRREFWKRRKSAADSYSSLGNRQLSADDGEKVQLDQITALFTAQRHLAPGDTHGRCFIYSPSFIL